MSNGTTQKIGVLVSGGAPTLHLAAGALCAFHELGVKFKVVAASGAGALPALLYMVPKNRNPQLALKSVIDLNIHDAIYNLIPSNYKVFFKYGPFSPLFWQLGKLIPHFPLDPKERSTNAAKRLYNDLIDFAITAITPTTLTYWSKSVLRRVQVVDDLVEWEALPNVLDQFFFLNTFHLADLRLENFGKAQMTPAHFYAALAMPWLYPPTAAPVGGPLYTEGASHDPTGIEATLENKLPNKANVDAMIALDTIGSDLWVDPESIHEGLELAIMDPIVTLAENVAALYALQDKVFNEPTPPTEDVPKLYLLPFEVPPWMSGKLLEWTYSNAVTLWDTGYRAAIKFCRDGEVANGQLNLDTDALKKLRYLDTLDVQSREWDFLRLFGDPGGIPPTPDLLFPPGGGGSP